MHELKNQRPEMEMTTEGSMSIDEAELGEGVLTLTEAL
jgi:hypothetical protein